ncbi:hypothetical protein TELCIR_05575 [Teladorsagia circumcincta]|uniref:Uncharacterized protein n=1 Tax=Teladorsagia circumcincta TaxID=45464 RepID=A0A2G9UQE8_TELCI|nr:hypothetical protein TELCIR_05575 [Teladorsagia circumcincta]
MPPIRAPSGPNVSPPAAVPAAAHPACVATPAMDFVEIDERHGCAACSSIAFCNLKGVVLKRTSL